MSTHLKRDATRVPALAEGASCPPSFVPARRGALTSRAIARLAAPVLGVTLGLALWACSEEVTEPDLEPGPGPEPETSWRESVVTDVVSGEDFRIDDLASGRVFVVVINARSEESRRQVNQVAELLGSLTPEVVVVSFDRADGREGLAEYYRETAYPFYFIVGTAELESRMLDAFGSLVLDVSAYPIVQICPDGGDRLLPPGLKLSGRLEREAAFGCGSDPREGAPVPLNGRWAGEMTTVSGERVSLSGLLTMTVAESGSGQVSGTYGYSLRGGAGVLESLGSVGGGRLDPTTLELDLNDELGAACSVRATLRQHGAILFGDYRDRCQGTQQGTMLLEPAAD